MMDLRYNLVADHWQLRGGGGLSVCAWNRGTSSRSATLVKYASKNPHLNSRTRHESRAMCATGSREQAAAQVQVQ